MKERQAMAGRGFTLASMMKFTAIVAVDLALWPGVADLAPESPLVAFIFASLNVVIIQSALLGRPLRTFHHTFLVSGTVSSIAFTVLTLGSAPGPWKAAASAMGVIVAWAVGLLAARDVRRRGSQAGSRV